MTTPYLIGEALLSESPHDPGYPIEVTFRGKNGDQATVVYDGGRQMTVPLAWLSRPANNAQTIPTPRPAHKQPQEQ